MTSGWERVISGNVSCGCGGGIARDGTRVETVGTAVGKWVLLAGIDSLFSYVKYLPSLLIKGFIVTKVDPCMRLFHLHSQILQLFMVSA